MHRFLLLLTAVGIIWEISPSPASAQQQVTLQLPTFSYFTVNTSVLVPDGGGAYLGGVNRAQSGSTYRGLPLASKVPFLSPLATNRGTGHAVAGGNMSVHATIIDHADLDQQVLSQALAQRGMSSAALNSDLALKTGAKENQLPAAAAVASVAEIRQQHLQADDAKQEEARQLFAKAMAYESTKQVGLAKIYYRMAANRATGAFRGEVLARIAALESGRGTKVARE